MAAIFFRDLNVLDKCNVLMIIWPLDPQEYNSAVVIFLKPFMSYIEMSPRLTIILKQGLIVMRAFWCPAYNLKSVEDGWRHVGSAVSASLRPVYIEGLVQDCSDSSALAMELLQSCTKPSTYSGCGHDPFSPKYFR